MTKANSGAIRLEMTRAYARADSNLPPCEGHKHAFEVLSQYQPPISCTKATEFFRYVVEYHSRIIENCDKMTRWIEPILQERLSCDLPNSDTEIVKNLMALKEFKDQLSLDNEVVGLHRHFDLGQLDLDADIGSGPGEFRRPECHIPVVLGMQSRLKQQGLVNKNYSIADYSLNSLCEAGAKDSHGYLDFLRHGEGGSGT